MGKNICTPENQEFLETSKMGVLTTSYYFALQLIKQTWKDQNIYVARGFAKYDFAKLSYLANTHFSTVFMDFFNFSLIFDGEDDFAK